MSKYYAINVQEVSWQDDGGAHDVSIIEVTDEDREKLTDKIKEILDSPDDDSDELLDDNELEMIANLNRVKGPVLVESAKSFWHSFGS